MKRVMRAALVLSLGVGFGGAAALHAPPPAAAAPVPTAATASAAATANPCAADDLAPTARTLAPVSVFTTTGTVGSPANLLSGAATRLSGNGSSVVLDFGKDVGGIVTLTFAGSSDSGQSVGLAFSESDQNVGENSDPSSDGGPDGALYAAVAGAGSYTVPADKLRGGLRYLTLFLNSSGWVDIDGVSLNFTAAPGVSDPAAYPDYFCSNDSLLNRIWYAGAYTVQLDTIAPAQGRVWPPPSSGWENNAVVGVGSEVLVDGAKRDRSVWPGDMGISVPTAYVSTDDLTATRNSLTTLYQGQKSTGELPYAGPEFDFYSSDTYHMWTLIGTYNYYLDSGDSGWLNGVWSQYQLGVNFITGKIDGNGLLDVTGTSDWARGDQGGENVEANALLYEVLTTGAALAQVEGNSSLAAGYTTRAASLKTQINALLWDASAGAYKDNPTSTLHPQDGNSLAVWYGVASPSQEQSVLSYLRSDWNSVGAQTPEFGDNVSPFAGSMELYAHFAADDDTNALNLMRTEWGYMLDSPIGTGSTFWEGMSNTGTLSAYGSYTSLAHGWSTGPTGALTSQVLGVSPTTAAGATYQVVPHPGDLTHVEGTLTVAPGKTIHVSYDHDTAGDFSMQVDSSTNTGSTGVIAVPTWGQSRVVTVNGATAWNGTSFTGATGIASATSDANYIYFRGVQPGVYTVAYPATGTVPPITYQALPGTWTLCAVENGTCSFSGTAVVAFGANGRFNYATATGSISCGDTAFSDPDAGVSKVCYEEAAAPAADVWSQCAAENATCTFSGVMSVAFGASGKYDYATLGGGGTACTDAVFGDPIVNTAKTCLLMGAPPSFSTWTACASENGTCSFTGTHEVAFGVGGQYFYRSLTGGTPCNDTVFGDPAFGTVKACYVQ
jgi:Bacterial alpha-L-rhamnosidase 6 hairpin glycosidase domain